MKNDWAVGTEWRIMDVEGWADRVIKGRRVRGKWPMVWMGKSSGQGAKKWPILRASLKGAIISEGPHKNHRQKKD
jgi:hypothetical protein